jgi:hypothetical protein
MTTNSNEKYSKFYEQYEKLDTSSQIELDNFLACIEEVGQHFVGETTYYGKIEKLNSFMPCLLSISSSVNIKDNYGDCNIHKLTWEPADFDIPADLLLRVIDRYTNSK